MDPGEIAVTVDMSSGVTEEPTVVVPVSGPGSTRVGMRKHMHKYVLVICLLRCEQQVSDKLTS